MLFESLKYSFQSGILSLDQRRGIINLIPKQDKDLRYLRNWRPLTILNTDYKILTKALANRLQKLLPKLINQDQVGYIKGRYIGQNIGIISDIQYWATKSKLPGYIVLVDFEKAFDSIEWTFLFKCLKTYNFGSNFIKWIKILYNNIQSCVGNNGHYSGYFRLTRGIRQGCPISALLFILVVETLSLKLRQEKSIHGIKVNTIEFKLCQLADDTTLFLKDGNSIAKAFTMLKKFEEISGLKVNLEKSTIIPIGISKYKQLCVPKQCKKIPIISKEFKTLGIWFSENTEDMTRLNFNGRIQSIEALLQSWSSRKLSLKGKIVILKTLALPLVNYPLSVCYCPLEILEKINKIIFQFLWEGKPPKIKRDIITADYSVGGLRAPDIKVVHEKAKISWIKRLIIDPNSNARWARLMWVMLKLDLNKLNHKLPNSYLNFCDSPFHKQVLECWFTLKNRAPQNLEEIQNEYIFSNQYICSNNIPLEQKNFRGAGDNLKDLTLKCIVNDNGKFLTIPEIKERLNWNISIYDYNIIRSSIPKKWTQQMLNRKPSMNVHSNITVSIKGILTNLARAKNKDIYWELIGNRKVEATAINTWVDLYPFLELVNWHKIFNAVHKNSIETYLQSFQYKVVHRIVNCRYNLYKWNIIESPLCIFCNHSDTIEHHFFLCAFSKLFWEYVETWLTDLFQTENKITFAICEILFGYSLSNKTNSVTTIINWIISLGKWFINFCRSKEKDINFIEFQKISKTKLGIYKNITCPAVEGVENELHNTLKSLCMN